MGYYELKGSKVQLNNQGAWCYAHETKLRPPSKQQAPTTQERASNAGEEVKTL